MECTIIACDDDAGCISTYYHTTIPSRWGAQIELYPHLPRKHSRQISQLVTQDLRQLHSIM